MSPWQGVEVEFVAALCFCILAICLRAANYRSIANDLRPVPLRAWMQVSLRHQFLFTAIPSGLGDIGFPVIARHHLGLDLKRGAVIILMARLRDLFVLPALGCFALAMLGVWPVLLTVLGIVLGLLALFLEQSAGTLILALRQMGLKVSGLGLISQPSWPVQLKRFAFSLGSWSSAACAVWFAYTAAGFQMEPMTSFVLLTGLNAIGVVAISVGGLGIAEAGSTGILTLLGTPLEQAAQISLVARPVLLIATLTACVTHWLCLRIWNKQITGRLATEAVSEKNVGHPQEDISLLDCTRTCYRSNTLCLQASNTQV
ncbi:MAG: lysylphosphatidylglycerol synthase transmembrane domain-containing protein [Pseudomonadota bacterium]